ncbi:hypothetical protein Vadar_005245 [Vaccinium darrowii]|uniref:Uncharacterized protein n=1 Tax=Vaccinium darrowii TaxID=229202 RepID=A0ACB7YJW5_9ERIC|nr:hypothetical protein Vadar_005245 [Vaccinium darrowii]
MKSIKQKKTREVEVGTTAYRSSLKSVEGQSNKDVINVDNISPGRVIVSSKPIPIKNLKSYRVHRLLSTEDKERISQIWSEAYTSGMGSCVYVDDIQKLLRSSSTYGSVIEAYTEILKREQSIKVEDFQNAIVFKSPEECLRVLDYWIPQAREFRYLHFPISHLHHLTLLVLDNEKCSWKFYNSMLLRIGVDQHFEVANLLKNKVENYLKSKPNGLFLTQECHPIQQMEDCPQQECSSKDCGIVVCYLIRQYFWKLPITSKVK